MLLILWFKPQIKHIKEVFFFLMNRLFIIYVEGLLSLMNKIPIICIFLIVGAVNAAFDINAYRTHRPSTTFKPKVITPLTNIPKEDLPNNFWWGNVRGVNYLTVQRNQHIPIYCGSCWAFASSSAMSDRIKIARKAQWPDINISPQVLISCETPDEGCGGGDAKNAY